MVCICFAGITTKHNVICKQINYNMTSPRLNIKMVMSDKLIFLFSSSAFYSFPNLDI